MGWLLWRWRSGGKGTTAEGQASSGTPPARPSDDARRRPSPHPTPARPASPPADVAHVDSLARVARVGSTTWLGFRHPAAKSGRGRQLALRAGAASAQLLRRRKGRPPGTRCSSTSSRRSPRLLLATPLHPDRLALTGAGQQRSERAQAGSAHSLACWRRLCASAHGHPVVLPAAAPSSTSAHPPAGCTKTTSVRGRHFSLPGADLRLLCAADLPRRQASDVAIRRRAARRRTASTPRHVRVSRFWDPTSWSGRRASQHVERASPRDGHVLRLAARTARLLFSALPAAWANTFTATRPP